MVVPDLVQSQLRFLRLVNQAEDYTNGIQRLALRGLHDPAFAWSGAYNARPVHWVGPSVFVVKKRAGP